MRPALLEARVLATVEALRRGVAAEDDFVECKREWPDPKKARQFAGLCNRASGADVVLIVGIDGRGALHDPGPMDPADWWASVRSQFDETPPDLVRHMRVTVAGGHVVALAFETMRVPYVVKNASGEGHVDREVPMRDAAGTHSAYRHELLRLLLPTIRTPPATLLHASLTAVWHRTVEAREPSGGAEWAAPARPEHASACGHARLYLEHLLPEFVMLPAHGMRGVARCADWTGQMTAHVDPPSRLSSPVPAPSRHGVEARHDGVLLTGPGVVDIRLEGKLSLQMLARIEEATDAEVEIQLEVSGATAAIRVVAPLRRQKHPADGLIKAERRTYFATDGLGEE